MTTEATAVLELEQALLDSDVRRDAERVRELLDEDFIEITSSGSVLDREQAIASLQTEGEVAWTMRDAKVRVLAADLVLVTYRVAKRAPSTETSESLRSSMWKRGADGWRLVFHQGTPANPR